MRHMLKQMHDTDTERCPLCGAARVISMIDGAMMLVIGTEECSYYTKSTLEMKGGAESCFSVVLDKNDVTFGSLESVTEAVHELLDEYRPKRLFLVTTCVVEIIGDDFTDLAQTASEKYKIPVEIISTNHYKGKNAEYGKELVFNAMGGMGSIRPNKFSMLKHKLGGRR